MNTLEIKRKRDLLLAETVESLRSKPYNSTMIDRMIVCAEASRQFRHLPFPLYVGNGIYRVAELAETPVSENDLLLGRISEKVPSGEDEALLQSIYKEKAENGFFMCDHGHTPFDWQGLLHLGLSGLAEKSADQAERRRVSGDDTVRVWFAEGMNLVHRAYIKYIERYADAAERAGLFEEAEICRNIVKGPPETFREALQLILLVGLMFSAYSADVNPTLCLGRMDDYLAPFYVRDIAEGRLDEERAGYLIDDFYCKWSLPMGRGEHQLPDDNEFDTGWKRNPMYDSPTYIILGGYSNHGDHKKNPLTELFLSRIQPRLENPVFVFRRTADVTDKIWTLVCDKLRSNASLLIYNDETMIKAFEHAGIEHEDAVNYTIHGCNWPDIQGLSTYGVEGMPIAEFIMKSLFGDDVRPTRDFHSVDEMYEKLREDYRSFARTVHANRRAMRERVNNAHDFRIADAFKRDTVEKATSAIGGAKYYNINHLIRNIGTGADIMAALETLLFGDDPVSGDTLADALRADFESYDDLLIRSKKAPKYGHDDDRADRHAVRLAELISDVANEESFDPKTGVRFLNPTCVTITDMCYIEEGARLGATPDGRRAAAPFSENLSPSRGITTSVTALINSVTKLPFDRICSGALNIRLSPDFVNGDDGLKRLCALLDVYFKKGGMQVQLSITDNDELIAAQKDPDAYRDLMVRITGYSAVFVDMSRLAQDEIIKRGTLN